MNSSEALISGIIQGLTEFLPVSSSGHLSLFQHFTNTAGSDSAVFTVILHLGTLAAVIIAFCPSLKRLLKAAKSLIFDKGILILKEKKPDSDSRLLILIVISLLPLIISFFLRGFFEAVSGDNDIVTEGICFIITSCLLYKASSVKPKGRTLNDMTVKDALLIGLMQSVSPMPGISRSGSTISASLFLGFDRDSALNFSFLMSIPTVAAAILTELPGIFSESFSLSFHSLLLGLAAAFISGLASIVLLKKLVVKNKLIYFARYTLILGILTAGIGILEHLSRLSLSGILYEIFKPML